MPRGGLIGKHLQQVLSIKNSKAQCTTKTGLADFAYLMGNGARTRPNQVTMLVGPTFPLKTCRNVLEPHRLFYI